MPDKKISELTLATPDDADVIPFTDVSASITYKALKSALKGTDGTNGTNGTDGDDAYVYVAYASADDGTDFTMTFDPALNYIAVKNTTTAIASPVASDFTGLWKNYKGATGTAGTDGTDGIDGTDGNDGISYIWKGTYDAGTSYSANDCVAYNGTSYIYVNVTPGSGHTPADDTYWDILALKGTDGAGGDVYGPATNTDSYIPQWDGADSKTLKDGLAVPAGGLAGLTALADKAPLASPTFTGTVTMPVGLTGVLRADTGVVSVDTTRAPLASPTFTGTVILPKAIEIQDTSADHQYVLAVNELTADRTVTLPLLTGNDEFVFKDHAQTLTNKTLSGTVTLADNCRIDLTLPTADTYVTGPTTDSFASGYTAAAFDLVFMGSSGKWLEVDADAVATCKGLIGIALEAKNDTEAMKVALPGSFVRFDTWNWTVGATLYAGETLGAIQEAIPTGADAVIKVIGFAVNADTIFFMPSSDQQTTIA